MYALIKNNTVINYPYSITDLRRANPNVSFPKQPNEESLVAFGVYPVFETLAPEVTNTQVLTENAPIFNTEKNRWEQSFTVRNKTSDEIQSETDAKAKEVRAERDAKLAETDWLVIKNLELNQNVPGIWEVYRQNLRDVPAQSGFPHNVTWPVKP